VRPTLATGALISASLGFLLSMLTIALFGLSVLIGIGVAVILGSIIFVLGIRTVRPGNRALLVVLGRPNTNGHEEYPEGICWIYPFFSHLEERSTVEQTSRLENVKVETGEGIQVTVSIAIQWSFVPTQLHLARRLDAPAEAVGASLEGRIKLFMGYVDDPADVTKGEVTRRLGKFLLDSVQLRARGISPAVAGTSWNDLTVIEAGTAHQPWGVAIHSLEVIRLDLPAGVREALHAARVDEITAEVAPKVGMGMAGMMKPVLEIGGAPELAQQQAQQHQKPGAEVIAPQPRTVVIPSGALDGDMGAMLTAKAIADQSALAERRRPSPRSPSPQADPTDPAGS